MIGPLMLALDGSGAASLDATLPRSVHMYFQAVTFSATEVGSSKGLDMYVR